MSAHFETLTSYLNHYPDSSRDELRVICIKELDNIVKENRSFLQNLVNFDLMNELKKYMIGKFSINFGSNFM